MSLVVHALGGYASYSRDEHEWRREDYDVNKFVKSLKGKDFVGYSNLRDVRGNWHRIQIGSRLPALSYFGAWAAKRLRTLNLGPIVLVPVPSSGCISYTPANHTPQAMALAIQPLMTGIETVHWLRFVEVMPKSSEGGGRDYSQIFDKLRVSPKLVSGAHAVLVDDVKTTGSHIKACAHRLRNIGVRVDVVLVAATTVWSPTPNPFDMQPVDLEPKLFDFKL